MSEVVNLFDLLRGTDDDEDARLADRLAAVDRSGLAIETLAPPRFDDPMVFDVEDFGTVDAAILAAYEDGGGEVVIHEDHISDGSITLRDRVWLRGSIVESKTSPTAAAQVRFTDPTIPGFIGGQELGLSHAGVERLGIVGASNTNPDHHAFDLAGVFNTTGFRDLQIQFFGGDVFHVGTATGDTDNTTALGAVLFENLFGVNCGGSFIRTDGNAIATLLAVDTNNVNGLLRLTGGGGDNQNVNIVGCWYEGGDATPIARLVDWSNNMLNVWGLSYPTHNPDAVVRIEGSGNPTINLSGSYGFNGVPLFIDDQVAGVQVPRGRGNVLYNGTTQTGNLLVESATPVFDIRNPDQHFRLTISGDRLVAQRRNPDGTVTASTVVCP